MRQYVGVASLVEILYLRLSSLSLPHTDTQYTVVVEGCQNKKKYKYLLKNNITIFKLQNFKAMDTWESD